MSKWDIDQARKSYNIKHWGDGFFDISQQGHLTTQPGRNDATIDLHQLTKECQAAGLKLPILARFPDILHGRIDTICNAFDQAIKAHDYQATYTAVYPIKVNQQRHVVESLLKHGQQRIGLEAGSKPELMAVLAHSRQDGGTIICNGYKDREYIRLALIGKKLGHQVYIVIEKLSELEVVIEESRALQLEPLLGIRIRLSSIGAGKWQNTGGEKSKFGLTSSQILAALDKLKKANLLSSLQLLHCHLGSQIANIRDIQRGMHECSRHYVELRQLGAPLDTLDVGGGLGVDYEGTRSRSYCSMNYTPQEYANNIVHTIWENCTSQKQPHPKLISESGRALTAHHAVLITNVIDHDTHGEPQVIPAAAGPSILQDLAQCLAGISEKPAVESYHDAVHWLSEAQTMYIHGVITLKQRAAAESLYQAICKNVRSILKPGLHAHREILDELNEKLADKYFCNFSLFQSIPDAWAIQQVFPIVPLHRLNEEPTRRGLIQDLTCDSDGRIDYYVNEEGVESTLPLHAFTPGEEYLLGIFMVGAYQEILGDMHNLFGDTDSVNVHVNQDGSYHLEEQLKGDTVDSVLRYVHFDSQELAAKFTEKLKQCKLNETERQQYRHELMEGLRGYTYLE